MNFIKKAAFPLMMVIGIIAIVVRQNDVPEPKSTEYSSLYGQTMGTTYSIKHDAIDKDLKASIDSILVSFNQSLSTYIQDSEISSFNSGAIVKMELPYLYPVLQKSREIFDLTNGAFDPTVMPLVNAWGFGPNRADQPDSLKVAELLKLVGMDSVYFDSVAICKLTEGIQLDFSAIAKGYGVDVVIDYLVQQGAQNMMVEIGGETRAVGLNERGLVWQIGVEDPTQDLNDRSILAVVHLNDRALATSGNYRNFYIKDGKKYAHTIDPKTGYPVEHSLLSASVMAKDCMTADAYATAFMVMGANRAVEIIEANQNLEGFLIYSDEEGNLKTYKSEKLKVGA